jgi:late competence protein required for DNA uptake (superfamily II DNA/RNA helicase)
MEDWKALYEQTQKDLAQLKADLEFERHRRCNCGQIYWCNRSGNVCCGFCGSEKGLYCSSCWAKGRVNATRSLYRDKSNSNHGLCGPCYENRKDKFE